MVETQSETFHNQSLPNPNSGSRKVLNSVCYPWHSPERNCGDKCSRPGEILGEELGEKLGEMLDEIFWVFSCFMCCAERPTKISPQIPPNLSLHVLSGLLWRKFQNFISASFWGLGRPKSDREAHIYSRPDNYYITWICCSGINYGIALHLFCVPQLINNYITRWCSHPRVVHRCIKNCITFCGRGGNNKNLHYIFGPRRN